MAAADDARKSAAEPVLACRALTRVYQEGDRELVILDGLELAVERGEKVAIVGSSGCGKTTLLNLLGGLDLPTSGDVLVAGESFSDLDERGRDRLRGRSLGFVFQLHHLLPEFSALENAALPMLIRGQPPALAKERAGELLEAVGIGHRLDHRPAELSGGERQRVAIARALVARPLGVLLDEPTGNLDSATAREVTRLLLDLNQRLSISYVVVTHEPRLAAEMDRTLVLENGRLRPASDG